MNQKLAKPDKSIKEHTEELLEKLDLLLKLGYIDKDKIYPLVEKACIYHDLGKLNKEFQERIKSENRKFDEKKEVSHNILSLYFVDKNKFDSYEDYLIVAHSVLNHHDYCNVFRKITEEKNLIKSLLEDLNTVELPLRTKFNLAKEDLINKYDAIKVKGYLHKCDYSASAGVEIEYENNFLEKSLDNLMEEWIREGKATKWNELQHFCKKNKDENIICVAQTGMGKTEAGLLWIGDSKGFFVLPIRTAINAIYDRVRSELLKNEKVQERAAILHSSSLEYYLKNIYNNSENKEDMDLLNYYKEGKQLSIPLNITTMDQIFDFVFKYNNYELKLVTLSYSKVVIDEIQAYDPELLAYLICGIENIVALGGRVAILTATLPPFIKDLLKKNINFKENDKAFTTNVVRHNVKTIDERINAEDIAKMYLNNKKLNKYNKILVVCNTVKKAQKLYEELAEIIDDKNELNILHSKFIRKDRLEKEKQILEFGNTYDLNKQLDKQNGIWISTSIVEASLDIDFDYLFTELQDLNSLFQRLGRCNRKGKKSIDEYNCYVYTEIDHSNIKNGDKGFIDNKLYELSKEAIREVKGELSETDKINLIEKYLTTDNLKYSDYMNTYKEKYEIINNIRPYNLAKSEVKLRNIISEEIIPYPIYLKYYQHIKEIEEKLNDPELKNYDEVKLNDDLKQYTVSVYPGDIHDYKKAKLNEGISIGKEKIKIIECEYGEAGYKKKV